MHWLIFECKTSHVIYHAKDCSKNRQVGGFVIGIVGKMQVFELGNSPRSGELVEL